MKRTILAATGFALIFAGQAHAALSGYWDSSKILHSILGRNDVANSLKQQPVESITRTDSGYQIKSHSCAVDVTVERILPNRPGPSGFKIRVGPSHCQ